MATMIEAVNTLLRSIRDYGDQRAAYERAEISITAVRIAMGATVQQIDDLITDVRAENAQTIQFLQGEAASRQTTIELLQIEIAAVRAENAAEVERLRGIIDYLDQPIRDETR